jgi:hypothetical protein
MKTPPPRVGFRLREAGSRLRPLLRVRRGRHRHVPADQPAADDTARAQRRAGARVHGVHGRPRQKKLNVLAADVASVFATMVPLVLAGARTFLVDEFSFGCARCSLHDTLIRQ